MDTGQAKFELIKAASEEELRSKTAELENKYPDHGGWFREGEIVELNGSRFRVKSVKPDELRLKLLKRGQS
jgi:hypothetical protein